MKFFAQCILIVLFIITIFFFYNKYFISKDKLNIETKTYQNKDSIKKTDNKYIKANDEKENIIDETNNLIKNLKYEIKLSDNSKYVINSDLSELTYINDREIVYMSNVEAIFIDKKNIALVIKADEAKFDSVTNNTNFKKNIKITYLDNSIFSEKADINFIENTILIYGNVLYRNLKGIVKTDNIKVNLINKNVFMFMNDSDNKIQLKSN
jgi:hypothetical protein